MTADPSTSPTAGPTGPSRRRVVAAVVVVAVVVVVVVVVKLASAGTSTTPSAVASGSPSPSVSSPATSATPGASVSPSGRGTSSTPTPTASVPASPTPSATTPETPKVLQTHKPVPMKTAAPFGDGVTAKIVGVVPVQSVAQGPGEISGPAIKVTISLKNGTKDAISVNQVTVNVTYGKQASPASDIQGDAIASIEQVGAKVLGIVLNGVPTKSSNSYYGYAPRVPAGEGRRSASREAPDTAKSRAAGIHNAAKNDRRSSWPDRGNRADPGATSAPAVLTDRNASTSEK